MKEKENLSSAGLSSKKLLPKQEGNDKVRSLEAPHMYERGGYSPYGDKHKDLSGLLSFLRDV